LTTSKTKQFCETSSIIFKVDNIKNETILREFLQKWNVECRAEGLVPMRFAIFPLHLSKVLRLPRKSEARSYEDLRSAAPVTQNHLSKPEDLMLENATPLRKSAPGPRNISGEHASCIPPATENASLQILFKFPTPANAVETATKPARFAHFNKVHNPLRLPRETTSKHPKVVRTCGAFNILTSTCASRHNGVHFSNISTSKSAPRMACFVHFELDFSLLISPDPPL